MTAAPMRQDGLPAVRNPRRLLHNNPVANNPTAMAKTSRVNRLQNNPALETIKTANNRGNSPASRRNKRPMMRARTAVTILARMAVAQVRDNRMVRDPAQSKTCLPQITAAGLVGGGRAAGPWPGENKTVGSNVSRDWERRFGGLVFALK